MCAVFFLLQAFECPGLGMSVLGEGIRTGFRV